MLIVKQCFFIYARLQKLFSIMICTDLLCGSRYQYYTLSTLQVSHSSFPATLVCFNCHPHHNSTRSPRPRQPPFPHLPLPRLVPCVFSSSSLSYGTEADADVSVLRCCSLSRRFVDAASGLVADGLSDLLVRSIVNRQTTFSIPCV